MLVFYFSRPVYGERDLLNNCLFNYNLFRKNFVSISEATKIKWSLEYNDLTLFLQSFANLKIQKIELLQVPAF